MRRLFVLPLLMLAFACSEDAIVQPAQEFGAATILASGTALAFRLLENPVNDDWGEVHTTPNGIMHVKGYDFGYLVAGDLVGSQHTRGGELMLNLNNGKGTASGTFFFDLTGPGTGTIECQFYGLIEDFPVHIQRGQFHACKGTGDYAGIRMKGTWTNENNPGVGNFDCTAEIW